MSLIVTHHPTFALLRQPFEAGAFICDLKRFGRLVRKEIERVHEKVIIEPTVDDVISIAQSSWFLACDIETGAANPIESWTGKDPTRAKLKTIALGTPEYAVALDCRRNHVKVRAEIAKVLKDKTKTKVFHNGFWFDLRVLARYGMEVEGPIEDTRDIRMALSPTSPLSLGYLASIYLDFEAWKENEGDDAKGLVHTKNIKKLLRYNGLDTIVTARIFLPMWEELHAADTD